MAPKQPVAGWTPSREQLEEVLFREIQVAEDRKRETARWFAAAMGAAGAATLVLIGGLPMSAMSAPVGASILALPVVFYFLGGAFWIGLLGRSARYVERYLSAPSSSFVRTGRIFVDLPRVFYKFSSHSFQMMVASCVVSVAALIFFFFVPTTERSFLQSLSLVGFGFVTTFSIRLWVQTSRLARSADINWRLKLRESLQSDEEHESQAGNLLDGWREIHTDRTLALHYLACGLLLSFRIDLGGLESIDQLRITSLSLAIASLALWGLQVAWLNSRSFAYLVARLTEVRLSVLRADQNSIDELKEDYLSLVSGVDALDDYQEVRNHVAGLARRPLTKGPKARTARALRRAAKAQEEARPPREG